MSEKKVTERAVEFILTRGFKDLKSLTVDKIADGIGVNKFYLSFRFLIDQRISLENFILREKMHEAYFILGEDKEKSIDELSWELGFSQIKDFGIAFEKYFAIDPEKFKDIKIKVTP